MKQRIVVIAGVVSLLAILAVTIVPITDAVTDTKEILVIGDMYSSGLSRYVTRLENIPCRIKVAHYGQASMSSTELLQDLAGNQELQRMLKQSDLVIVSLGTNDLLQLLMDLQELTEENEAQVCTSEALHTYKQHLHGILTKLNNYHKPILLADLFNPLLEGEDNYQAAETLTKSYNQILYETASRSKVKVAPVNEEFLGYGTKSDLITDMDFALTNQGEDIFAQAFMRITDSQVKELLVGKQ